MGRHGLLQQKLRLNLETKAMTVRWVGNWMFAMFQGVSSRNKM